MVNASPSACAVVPDDVGMKMQAKMFIQDKYNWIKDKLKRKDQFDGKDGSQF